MEKKIEIVPMTPELALGAAALEQATFSEPWSTEAFVSEARQKNACYFVAVRDGQVVGFAGMRRVLDECSLTNIAVAPACRSG